MNKPTRVRVPLAPIVATGAAVVEAYASDEGVGPIVLPPSEQQRMITPESCHARCPALESHSFSAIALLAFKAQ